MCVDRARVEETHAQAHQRIDQVIALLDRERLQQLGMQTVVMGPGSIREAHQPDEFMDRAQIAPAVRVLERMIERFCVDAA